MLVRWKAVKSPLIRGDFSWVEDQLHPGAVVAFGENLMQTNLRQALFLIFDLPLGQLGIDSGIARGPASDVIDKSNIYRLDLVAPDDVKDALPFGPRSISKISL